MDSLIVYPDGSDKPGVEFPVANGFVSRVVSAVADMNIEDAVKVCAILNAHADKVPRPARVRRMPVGECAYCDERGGSMMMPPHDASPRCESGKRPHCTCTTCF